MHLEDTELEESNLSQMHVGPPGFVSHQQLDQKILCRELHQYSIIECEKFIKVVNKSGNLWNLNLVSCALEYSL